MTKLLTFLHIYFDNKKATLLLKFLLCIDVLFIVVHVLCKFLWADSMQAFFVDMDRGYPEFFQYFKYILIILCAGYLMLSEKRYYYISWLFLFLVLLLDNNASLHETWGVYFAETFDLKPAFGLRAVDFGELIYSAGVGVVFIVMIAFSFYNGSQKFKKTCWDIVLLFSFFLLFGIGVDMVHSFFEHVYAFSGFVALIEDGGEMVALSFLTWYFYFLTMDSSNNDIHLHDFFFSKKKRMAMDQ